MKRQDTKKKVFVAMSGGVDSSVAAALLKKEGYELTGVFMKPWQPEKGLSFCVWQEEREDALRVCSALGIPFETWDFSKEYKKEVADYMVREYKAGRTPNPDVMCNKEIKFGFFLKEALRRGADYIATGHYVIKKELTPKRGLRSERAWFERSERASDEYQRDCSLGKSSGRFGVNSFGLFQAKDKNKDQSYFLWTLKEKQIEKCLFPVGEYTKPEIRKLAKKFKIPVAEKKDSQGVCFIGPLNVKDFLASEIASKPGKIIMDGKVIGKHDGVFYYTIGQRHGLDIKDGKGRGPFYIIKKDFKKNIIYVGGEKDLMSSKAKITKLSWANGGAKLPAALDVKIRYRTQSQKAVLKKDGTLEFKKPVRAITSGQSAVFYKGEQVLGGGIIK